MEELSPPVKIHHSRKRKKTLPSSTPSHLIGSLTRSKSRIYFHQNRSGTSRSDPIRSKSDSFYPDPVEASTDPIPCNNSPRISSVKDLRIRRVFTPDVNSVHHQEEEEEVNDENENRKKLLKCTDSDPYLGDVKLDGLEKSEVIEIGSKTGDAFEIGLNLNHQGISENGSDSNTKMAEDAQNDLEIGLNLNHQGISENGPDSNTIMAEEAQNDFENGLNGISENGFDSNTKMAEDAQNEFEIGLNLNHQGISEIVSNSNTKMALNRCRRRKVFKTSSSFSYKRMLPYLMDISNDDSSVTKIEIVEAVIPSKLQKFDSVKSEMMSVAKSSGTQFDDTNPSDTKMPIGQEPPVQMTPPDPSIFTDTEVDHGVSDKQILKGSNEKSNGNVSSTNSIYGSVHNPRSRVFNNPGSLGYRRLLPFLMNISQNNTCDSRVTQQAMPLVDKEKDTVEKDDVSETIIEKQPTGDQTQDYSPPSNGSSLEFNNDLVNPMVSNGEPSLEPLMAINLDVEKMPPSDTDHKEVELSVGMKEICIEPGPVEKDSGPVEKESRPVEKEFRPVEKEPEPVEKMPSDNETSNEQATSKEPGPVEKEKVCSDMGLEPYNNNNNNVAPISSVEAMVSPAIGSFKGILKRNPRGCRGLCNCLNCASFRLHADRAFEFSRNQMQDAEEVASDLMKELAKLRCLMEKSIIRDDNDNLAGIQLNPPLVKEACNKALEAENLAKGRLNQLNYDLNVHCRIPMLLEPKVSFSNSRIQENAIPVTDSFAASPEKKG